MFPFPREGTREKRHKTASNGRLSRSPAAPSKNQRLEERKALLINCLERHHNDHTVRSDTSRNWNRCGKKRGFFRSTVKKLIFTHGLRNRFSLRMGRKNKVSLRKPLAWFCHFRAFTERNKFFLSPKQFYTVGGHVFLPRTLALFALVCSVRDPCDIYTIFCLVLVR